MKFAVKAAAPLLTAALLLSGCGGGQEETPADEGSGDGAADASGYTTLNIIAAHGAAETTSENLSFLNQFEPFENLLKEERKLLVKDVMSEPKHTVATDVPLFQLTVNIVKNSLPSLMVVDKQQKLCGIITYIELVTNVLRG